MAQEQPRYVKVEDLPKPFNQWQSIQTVKHVEQHLLSEIPESSVAVVINHLQNLLNMSQKQESYVVSTLSELMEKKRELEKDIEVINDLKIQKPLKTKFQLADSLYADATVEPIQNVNIWLSNTLLVEYPLDEAIEMLKQRQDEVEKKRKTAQDQRKLLKKYITTIQVSIFLLI
eukprot:NODE_1_length_95616_cov_0.657642.p61 type:complete len:174 gc:universal NODE_1_length_95616_cov_0.657642:48007-48528(+)